MTVEAGVPAACVSFSIPAAACLEAHLFLPVADASLLSSGSSAFRQGRVLVCCAVVAHTGFLGSCR